ncbi:MAG: 50S ribosomal protein L21 [Solirubrobacterales bacterium]
MYAVVETGGKQYRVEKGDTLLVDRLRTKEGGKVTLRPLAFSDKEMLIGSDAAKVKVEATVAEHLRGPKIRVFRYKAKKGYKKQSGHRSELTRLEITGISAGGAAAKQAPAERKAPAAEKAAESKPAAKKEAADGA